MYAVTYRCFRRWVNDLQGLCFWRFVRPQDVPPHSALRLRLKVPHVLFPQPHTHKTPPAKAPSGLTSGA